MASGGLLHQTIVQQFPNNFLVGESQWESMGFVIWCELGFIDCCLSLSKNGYNGQQFS